MLILRGSPHLRPSRRSGGVAEIMQAAVVTSMIGELSHGRDHQGVCCRIDSASIGNQSHTTACGDSNASELSQSNVVRWFYTTP